MMIRKAGIGIQYNINGDCGMKPLPEPTVPHSCKVRHLWDTLYECLMNPSLRCDKAMVVGTTCYCRHPNRSNLSKATEEIETHKTDTATRSTG